MKANNNATKHQFYDAVVMLTWSNWFTELRSNRYNYATRFARENTVIFVQPDLPQKTYKFVSTEFDTITVLRVYEKYGPSQTQLINKALLKKSILRPLLWVYNTNFTSFLSSKYSPLVVYHATEDYLASDSPIHFRHGSPDRMNYQSTLDHTDLLLSVSNGVEQGILQNTNFKGPHHVISNGTDHNFYKPTPEAIKHILGDNSKIAFYQGNITDKLNIELLEYLANNLSDWTFVFCGRTQTDLPGWDSLLEHKNVKYLGCLNNEMLREAAWNATVGLIPFDDSDWLTKRSFPLKSFEYLSCGLQVISIPIKALEPYADVISFANTKEKFLEEIQKSLGRKSNKAALEHRLNVASMHDYDIKFNQALEHIESASQKRHSRTHEHKKLKVLILYDKNSLHVKTIDEYLSAFHIHSKNHISYANATGETECDIDLSCYEVIAIHYSIRVSVTTGSSALSKDYIKKLKSYGGYKILFLQDEYETTETTRQAIENLGINHVYTCVPDVHIEKVFPKSRFPSVTFEQVLTGYVPDSLITSEDFISIADREYTVAYRGRALPYWYGDLGQEKLDIAISMKAICKENGISENIEWEDSKRIYSDDWYAFLRNTRATLGTESGSNVFDETGEIKNQIQAILKKNPNITYDAVRDEVLEGYDIGVKMNQISPKMFESIALGTVLILYEGDYSKIIQPDVHYISLKKDFSNIESVLKRLNNYEYLETMRNKAYQDIIQSGKYSYKIFISQFDTHLQSLNLRPRNKPIFSLHDDHTKSTHSHQTHIRNHLNADTTTSQAREKYLIAVTYIAPVAKYLIPQRCRPIVKKLLSIQE